MKETRFFNREIFMSLATGRLATGTARATKNIASAAQIGLGLAPVSLSQIPEGKITATIYTFIRDGRYQDVIKILSNENNSQRPRASLSLLGYCYFQVQEYYNATECYSELVRLCPEVQNYRLYLAQSLYKSGQYADAQKACSAVDHPDFASRITKLEAAIRYELEDFAGCRVLVEQGPRDDPDTISNQACLLFKECNFEEACGMYMQVSKIVGFRA